MLYKTTAALIMCTLCFGAVTTDLGVRITTQLWEESEGIYVQPDTWITEILQTPYTGIAIDFQISPYKNFYVRTSITELRFLYRGGTEFLIFPQIGADLSYALPVKKFFPYLTAGLYYRRIYGQEWYNYRAGLGLAYQLSDKIKPYIEIQGWNKVAKSEPFLYGWGGSSSELIGLAKFHLGTIIKLGK